MSTSRAGLLDWMEVGGVDSQEQQNNKDHEIHINIIVNDLVAYRKLLELLRVHAPNSPVATCSLPH